MVVVIIFLMCKFMSTLYYALVIVHVSLSILTIAWGDCKQKMRGRPESMPYAGAVFI